MGTFEQNRPSGAKALGSLIGIYGTLRLRSGQAGSRALSRRFQTDPLRKNAAVAAGKISLVEIRRGFLPADYCSNRDIPAANSFVGPQ